MSILDIESEAQLICIRLYNGWIDKNELPMLARDTTLYRTVQDKLAWLGLELIDRPECPWYVVRIQREHDSFTQYQKRNARLKNSHMALLLILYAKLLLPRRAGQVEAETELSISFEELYQNYGYKFAPSSRKPASENRIQNLVNTLAGLGFIVKKRGAAAYQAGPAMYMLHEELLGDIAESSFNVLFGLSADNDNVNEERIY